MTDDWIEIEPCVWIRWKPYTIEQLKQINTRPTQMINDALTSATKGKKISLIDQYSNL
jgi:hypothetical protein